MLNSKDPDKNTKVRNVQWVKKFKQLKICDELKFATGKTRTTCCVCFTCFTVFYLDIFA